MRVNTNTVKRHVEFPPSMEEALITVAKDIEHFLENTSIEKPTGFPIDVEFDMDFWFHHEDGLCTVCAAGAWLIRSIPSEMIAPEFDHFIHNQIHYSDGKTMGWDRELRDFMEAIDRARCGFYEDLHEFYERRSNNVVNLDQLKKLILRIEGDIMNDNTKRVERRKISKDPRLIAEHFRLIAYQIKRSNAAARGHS